MNCNLQVSPNVSGSSSVPTTSARNRRMNGALLCSSTRTSTCELYRGERKRGRKKRSFLERSSSLRLFTRKPYPVKKPHALTRDGPFHRGNLQIGHMCFLFYRTHSALWFNIQRVRLLSAGGVPPSMQAQIIRLGGAAEDGTLKVFFNFFFCKRRLLHSCTYGMSDVCADFLNGSHGW